MSAFFAEFAPEAFRQGSLHRLELVWGYEGDDTPSEAGARHSTSPYALLLHCYVDKGVEFRTAHLVVILEAHMALMHEFPEPSEVALFEGGQGTLAPQVFRYDMAGAPHCLIAHGARSKRAFHLGQLNIAQRRLVCSRVPVHSRHCLLAGGDARLVRTPALAQGVLDRGVGD